MSVVRQLPPGAALLAEDSNAIASPLLPSFGDELVSSAGPASAQPPCMLTKLVWLLVRSRRKMSRAPLPSPVTKFVASDANATKRASALIVGARLAWFDCVPPVETLARVVWLAVRSRTKISVAP